MRFESEGMTMVLSLTCETDAVWQVRVETRLDNVASREHAESPANKRHYLGLAPPIRGWGNPRGGSQYLANSWAFSTMPSGVG